MTSKLFSRYFLGGLIALALSASAAQAAIVVSGGVTPADSTTWNISTAVQVGVSINGTVVLSGGSSLTTGVLVDGNDFPTSDSVVIDGAGTLWNTQFLTVGAGGIGRLSITNGGKLTSSNSTIGSSNIGTVTVDGAGSSWNSGNGPLNVGQSQAGTLNITHGATVTSGFATVGYSSGRPGNSLVNVDGAGSTWTITNGLTIGTPNADIMRVANGGKIAAGSIAVEPGSLLAMSAGDGSLLTGAPTPPNGTPGILSVANFGTVRFNAVPNLAPGTYSPVNTPFPLGGTIQSLGGNWNDFTHTFVVSAASTGAAGQSVSINLAQTQRIFITDPITGNTVEAGFQPTATPTTLALAATKITTPESSLLAATLPAGVNLLTGWDFVPTGYTQGTPVHLSMQIGGGFSVNDLQIWHFDGTAWTSFSPTDLSYDGTYASFTVTGFSGYAVAVPEPASLSLLALGTLCLLRKKGQASARFSLISADAPATKES